MDGTTLVDGVVVGVVVLVVLGPPLWPPPQPTASTSIAAPPNTAIVVLGPDLIATPISKGRRAATPPVSYPGARACKLRSGPAANPLW